MSNRQPPFIHSINTFFVSNRYSLLWVTVVAMLVRLCFFPLQSWDYNDFLHLWFEEIKAGGGLAAIGQPVGNYMVSYVYILALLTYLPIPDLISIKIVSCVGDILLAWYAMRLTAKVSGNPVLPKAVYAVVLFLPTIVLNSSAWAQCDSLYSTALLACIYYFMEEQPAKAMVAFGISFVLKLQAVFLMPLLFLLFLKRRLPIRNLFLVPLVYGVTILPAYLAGRPLWELLTLYVSQAGTYTVLSLHAPNLYAWLNPDNTRPYALAGIAFAAVFILVVVCLVIKKNIRLSSQFLLKFALLSAVMVPFLLPHMHERYFYLADALAVIYFFLFPQMRRPAIIVVSCSFLVVCRFLFGWMWVSAAVLHSVYALMFAAIQANRVHAHFFLGKRFVAHARIYDRILERCAPVRFSGRNYRTENAENTKKAIREIFTQEDSL